MTYKEVLDEYFWNIYRDECPFCHYARDNFLEITKKNYLSLVSYYKESSSIFTVFPVAHRDSYLSILSNEKEEIDMLIHRLYYQSLEEDQSLQESRFVVEIKNNTHDGHYFYKCKFLKE